MNTRLTTFLLSVFGSCKALALLPLAVHIDMQPSWTSNAWQWTMRTDAGNKEPQLYFLPLRSQGYEDGGDRYVRPEENTWDFLGVGGGEPLWFLSQTDNGHTWPGFNNTQASVFGSYFEKDPRVNSQGKWLKFRLKGVDRPAGGDVSLYVVGSGGNPVIWMATADGIDESDTFYMRAGDHSHTNWGFTRKGIWKLRFTVQGYLGANATNPTPESPETSFIFAVGTQASWRAARYDASEVTLDSLSGPSADADGDGVSNLLEYAFGGNPRIPSLLSETGSPLLPVHGRITVGGRDYLTIRFFRRKADGHPDVLYSAQWRSDLGPGKWTSGGVPVSVTSKGEVWEEVVIRDSVALADSARRFVRIHVAEDMDQTRRQSFNISPIKHTKP